MGQSRLEARFQADLIKELKALFPGCFILKNDANYCQGVPDLLILWRSKWAMLECKESATADEQPNQGYWVEHLDRMSFAAFIYPENAEDVLYELQQAFRARRKARVS